MGEYSRREIADRAGVDVERVASLVDLGILSPDEGDRFTSGDVGRIGLLESFVTAGVPLESLAAGLRKGDLSLTFMDSPAYARSTALAEATFQELSIATGVPVALLMLMREAIGAAVPQPDDRIRETEMAIVPLLEAQVESGFDHAVIERALRAIGDSLRRVAEIEADSFRGQVIERRAPGMTGAEISAIAAKFTELLTPLNEQALLAIYRAHLRRAWTDNIIGAWERALAGAGLSGRLERPPAICFLDITGYTRMTEERGDAAAADLAEQLGREVQRTSLQHGGRPVKWLGDGVMFYFRDPGPGVMAALQMVRGVADAGLPPAHVGLHAGPVVFQQGDYYGQTVNVAARIADYARPGEVVVSQAVVEASDEPGLGFTEIGPVELKGVAGTTRLHSAHLQA